MSLEQTFAVKYSDWENFPSEPPLTSIFQADGSNIQVAQYRQRSIELAEMPASEHAIILPLGHGEIDLEYTSEGRYWQTSYRERDFASGCVEIRPAERPYGLRCKSNSVVMEWIQCSIEPTFIAHIAYEWVNPDRVQLLETNKKVDVLLHHMCLALKSSLEVDGGSDRFYVDSMTTALSAHLLRHYSTCGSSLRDYEDGLPKQMLKQATNYMQAHLNHKVSLRAISQELGVSQYYFCRLFKQSLGVSPHQYLMQQRIEQAKYLLKKTQQTVTSVAIECGFANQSHFAKYFHKFTGMNPKQFRDF